MLRRFPSSLRLPALATALIAPTLFALWAALVAYQSGIAAKQAGELPRMLLTIRHDFSIEELLARDYRNNPNGNLLADYAAAASEVTQAIASTRAQGAPDAGARIARLAAAHRRYRLATDASFAALVAGDPHGSAVIVREQIKPAFYAVEIAILEPMTNAAACQNRYEHREARFQHGVLIATPFMLILDLALVLVFVLARRSDTWIAAEAAKREADIIRQSERRLRALVQNSSDVALIGAPSGIITYQSPTATSTWSYPEGALLGQPLAHLVHPEDQPLLHDLWEQLRDAPGATRNTEIRLRLHDGAWHHNAIILTNLTHEASIRGMVVTARDIEERKIFEQKLTHRAFYDPLTELPNRLLFDDRLDQALVRSGRNGRQVGLLFIDLDGFKLINDSLGHAVGDQLLIKVAMRLSECGRAEDTVARLGGDEFVVLIDNAFGEADARVVATNIAMQFRQPFMLDARKIVITASIGIALGDACSETSDSLLGNADIAMYRAKSTGKGLHVVFDASMRNDSLARLDLEDDLRRALDNNELRVHYQPIVDITTSIINEVEALVRWQHPTRGLIPPATFISIAEENGMIVPLGYWVLEHACSQTAHWHAAYPSRPPLMLSVNLSPRQFQQPHLDKEISKVLQRTGMKAKYLTLEITESVIMQDVDRTIAMLRKLKDLGIKLAVDDFGTGYSSLAYLKRLPLDVLKIDQSFVQGIDQNREDPAIVQAIMSLAKALNLSVTGEGIETAEQAVLLNAMACDFGQGYFFAKPLDSTDLTALLQSAERLAVPAEAALAS